jgi:serine/threonine protein kinase
MSVRFETDAEPIPGYKLMDRLGSGGFGEVWRCEAPGGIFKAVKVIHGDLRNRETDAYRFAEQELKALKRVKQVRHPYLLALDRYDIVDGKLMIVMELADCNLWDRFRECRTQGHQGIPRDELLQYMQESAEVLDLMNDKYQLQHLDIKPQNLFLLYNHVKVADFGQVKDLEGLIASVTGGITPVYAAPETFDGFVSRFCDQYSLACVYQELLTGLRPFDGTSMQQLLMQHLQGIPNLNPSPSEDRPTLLRALAKKPEERFPSVTAMVRALREGGEPIRVPVGVGYSLSAETNGSPTSASSGIPAYPVETGAPPGGSSVLGYPVSRGPGVNQGTGLPSEFIGSSISGMSAGTPYPRSGTETLSPPERPAPPEVTGPGVARPALIVGLGYSGLRVLLRLRAQLEERYGSCASLPSVRMLYIDTDPDTLDAATRPWNDVRKTSLPSEAIVPIRLNRAAHYLKPRVNGRAVIEGWFDSQVLYKLPRTPTTMGIRQLGRLAFSDHFRAVMTKLELDLDECLKPEHLATTSATLRQECRTNRPRVYVVAGLGGGTGSGMAIDLAYSLKARLRRIGYSQADIVGILLAPADGPPSAIHPSALANTYATLTELNHYANPDTAYVASFDDRHGNLRDNDPPFSRTVILPGLDYPLSGATTGVPTTATISTGRTTAVKREAMTRSTVMVRNAPQAPTADPTEPIADYLRLDLFSLVGRTRDEAIPIRVGGSEISTLGMQRFGWPRMEVVRRTARIIAPVLLAHWVSPDTQHVRELVPNWVEQLRHRLGLTSELLTQRLRHAANEVAANPVEELLRQATTSLTPKGWLTRLPDPEKVSVIVDYFVKLIGPPRDSPNRVNTPIEDALIAEAAKIAKEMTAELTSGIPGLLDHTDFRLAGTEEAVRQLLIAIEVIKAKLSATLPEWETSSNGAYDRLVHHMYQHKGVKKLTAQEIFDAAREYPTQWYQVIIARQVIAVIDHLHEVLYARLEELSACRSRVEEFQRKLVSEAEIPASSTTNRDLLPVGCHSTEDAAQRFLQVLNDDDLSALEQRVQEGIEAEFGGVFEACLNSAEGPESLLRIMQRATREYLDERLGEVDLAGMMKQRFGSTSAVNQALHKAYLEACPRLVGSGPWSQSEVVVFSAPEGTAGELLHTLAHQILPDRAHSTFTPDEVVLIREYPQVPISALPQLGPAWSSAYRQAADVLPTTPHARVDITQWIDVDAT